MDIYEYDDFRRFLKDAFDARKSQDPGFSHRRFAESVGIRNPGYLVDVIKAKRKLSEKLAAKTAEAFGLKPLEAEFFLLLVQYGQSRRAEEKHRLYQSILTRRNHSNFVRLNPRQTRYYEDTLYPLLIGALQATDFRGEYEELAAFLDPPVATGKVKKAIRELCDWGLVEQHSDGSYKVVEDFLEPPETMAGLVRRINREWLLQASESLFRHGADKRHISTIILSVSRETRLEIEQRLEAFRRDVFDLVRSDKGAEQVMQLSLAYLPKSIASKKAKKGGTS